MTFDSDLEFALSSAESEFGTTARWYRTPQAVGESLELVGVFNERDETIGFVDAGYDPEIQSTFLCRKNQFDLLGGIPAIGQLLVIDSTVYRIASFTQDSISFELSLRKK